MNQVSIFTCHENAPVTPTCADCGGHAVLCIACHRRKLRELRAAWRDLCEEVAMLREYKRRTDLHTGRTSYTIPATRTVQAWGRLYGVEAGS